MPLRQLISQSFWRVLCVYRLFIQRCIQRRGKKIPAKHELSFSLSCPALDWLPASSEKGTFWHLSAGSNILKCWKGETKKFPCAAFLSDLLSHMFPSGMHKKFLWIIHKYLGRNQLLLPNKKIGYEADFSCSILLYLEENWVKRK